MGVMTNSPPYDSHMLYFRNYVQLSKYAHEGRLIFGETQFKPQGEGSGGSALKNLRILGRQKTTCDLLLEPVRNARLNGSC